MKLIFITTLLLCMNANTKSQQANAEQTLYGLTKDNKFFGKAVDGKTLFFLSIIFAKNPAVAQAINPAINPATKPLPPSGQLANAWQNPELCLLISIMCDSQNYTKHITEFTNYADILKTLQNDQPMQPYTDKDEELNTYFLVTDKSEVLFFDKAGQYHLVKHQDNTFNWDDKITLQDLTPEKTKDLLKTHYYTEDETPDYLAQQRQLFTIALKILKHSKTQPNDYSFLKVENLKREVEETLDLIEKNNLDLIKEKILQIKKAILDASITQTQFIQARKMIRLFNEKNNQQTIQLAFNAVNEVITDTSTTALGEKFKKELEEAIKDPSLDEEYLIQLNSVTNLINKSHELYKQVWADIQYAKNLQDNKLLNKIGEALEKKINNSSIQEIDVLFKTLNNTIKDNEKEDNKKEDNIEKSTSRVNDKASNLAVERFNSIAHTILLPIMQFLQAQLKNIIDTKPNDKIIQWLLYELNKANALLDKIDKIDDRQTTDDNTNALNEAEIINIYQNNLMPHFKLVKGTYSGYMLGVTRENGQIVFTSDPILELPEELNTQANDNIDGGMDMFGGGGGGY